MPRFFVRFESKLRVRLATYRELQQTPRLRKRLIPASSSQPSFVAYDLVRQTEVLGLPNGLGMDAQIEAPTIVEAIRRCSFAANYFVDIVTFTTQAEPSLMKFVLAYDATPGIERRQLIADNSLGPVVVSRRIKDYLLQPILVAVNTLRNAAQSSAEGSDRIEKIDRAMKWLRKGTGETAIIDEFTSYWVGLEALDPIIKPVQRIFRTCSECGEVIDHCNHCGREITKAEKITNVLEGVRFIMEEKLGIPKTVFNKIRALRGALLHGGKGLGESELKLLTTYMPLFRRGLIGAISISLQLSEAVTTELMLPDPRRAQSDAIQRLTELVLIDELPTLDDVDRQPRIELDVKKKLQLTENNDDVSESYQCQVREINCRLIPGTERKVDILADPFAGIKVAAEQTTPLPRHN